MLLIIIESVVVCGEV